MKKVLITGANSYIGTSFESYMAQFEGYSIDTLDMMGEAWKQHDFFQYDVIFHVAGIAHSDSGRISEERAKLYYSINCDLAEMTAQKAKAEGVSQFIYMSSMIIYGASAPIGRSKMIDRNTIPVPENAYGDSKLQAEKKLQSLQDETFNVVILRPPMIYGKGSKGNYPVLSKFAKKLPVFPYIDNARSMLYIENLCEFIRLMIINNENGTYMPQNQEHVTTSLLVKEIANCAGRNICLTPVFNPLIKLGAYVIGVVNKVFGSLAYDMAASEYEVEYRVVDFKESVKRTER